MEKSKITVTIPAFNEAQRIGNVLKVVQEWETPHETIVVDDGSQDNTSEIAKKFDVFVIRLEKNSGKSVAMACGVMSTKADIIIFLDADLVGLKTEHLDQLADPVIKDDVKMCIGIRDRGFLVQEFSRRFLPLISGERVMKRELWEKAQETISKQKRAAWKIEAALNYTARVNNWRIGTVCLKGLRHTPKEKKRGLEKGFRDRVDMTRDIAEAYADLYLRPEGVEALIKQEIIHYSANHLSREKFKK